MQKFSGRVFEMNAVINMLRKTFSISDVLVSAACGTIAAACVVPFSLIALIVFGFAVFGTARARVQSGRTRFATANFLISILLFGGLVGSAWAYRPTKIEDQLLRREIKLPATQMTLAELCYIAAYDRQVFPISISFCFADADKETLIRWQSQDVTLGKFLDAIESQSVLRRRFMNCGNGYTILHGGDCTFGLYVRDPELTVPPFSRTRFDVEAYAANRNPRITAR